MWPKEQPHPNTILCYLFNSIRFTLKLERCTNSSGPGVLNTNLNKCMRFKKSDELASALKLLEYIYIRKVKMSVLYHTGGQYRQLLERYKSRSSNNCSCFPRIVPFVKPVSTT